MACIGCSLKNVTMFITKSPFLLSSKFHFNIFSFYTAVDSHCTITREKRDRLKQLFRETSGHERKIVHDSCGHSVRELSLSLKRCLDDRSNGKI